MANTRRRRPPAAPERALIVALVALSAASGALPGLASTVSSGVRGRVLYGPTCPVQRIGQTCTRPYQATISVRREPGSRMIASIRSSAGGYFSLGLAPGRYLLAPRSGHPFPHAAPRAITVYGHRYTYVTITYDSGIR